jgi:hypothetical protein
VKKNPKSGGDAYTETNDQAEEGGGEVKAPAGCCSVS